MTAVDDARRARTLEVGDAKLASFVRKWRAELADLADEGYEVLVDAVTERQARRVGVDCGDWLTSSAQDRERAHALLDEVDRAGLAALWDEPHALGWLHQHFGEHERDASNRAHTRDEHKHASQTVTTQLYTPRWIADFLAKACIDACKAASPTVCDPALGGGQMLLAALDALVDRGASPDEAASLLYGVDLDRRAVSVARRSLKLHLARKSGARRPAAEAAVDQNLRCDDGLFGEFVGEVGGEQGRFDVVLTNPPYMGSRSMPAELKARIRGEFRPFHADLYTAFIRRCHTLSRDTIGVLAQQTVWFLSRFEKARRWLLDHGQLVAFMHLGAHAFANLSGEKASVVAFVQKLGGAGVKETRFVDLRGFTDAAAKLEAFVDAPEEAAHRESTAAFDVLPGKVIAHWLPRGLRRHFETGRRLGDIADIPGSQNKTGKNRRYVKAWSEVAPEELRSAPEIFGEAGASDTGAKTGRWVFYSKGGRFAPWWGNWQNVVDWSEEARAFYADNRTSNLLDESWWFRRGICYTDFGGRTFNARLMPEGCVFDMAGPAIFAKDDDPDTLYALLALLNSTPVRALLNAMNPSLHYQVRDLRNLPVPGWGDDGFGAELQAELARRARRLVEGTKQLAAFVSESPRSLVRERADAQQVREFVEELPRLEHELDRMVCELYGCPELLVAVDDRPVHDYIGKLEIPPSRCYK